MNSHSEAPWNPITNYMAAEVSALVAEAAVSDDWLTRQIRRIAGELMLGGIKTPDVAFDQACVVMAALFKRYDADVLAEELRGDAD